MGKKKVCTVCMYSTRTIQYIVVLFFPYTYNIILIGLVNGLFYFLGREISGELHSGDIWHL